MKTIFQFFGLCILLCVTQITWGQSGGAWQWENFTLQQDIWMRSYQNHKAMFDYRLGPGGAISEMRYCPDGLRALLAPSYQTEETDRIIQSVFWGQTDNVQDVKNGKGFERNFNINLGGNASNQYAPIISVQRDAQKIDIYTVPFAQFLADFDPAFTGPVSHFSRYEMRANGVLKIRRIILIPDIKKNGISVGAYQLYYEQWNPFLFSNTTFNRMAYHLYKDGTPNANYLLESPALNAENPIPYYPIPLHTSPRQAEFTGIAGTLNKDGDLL